MADDGPVVVVGASGSVGGHLLATAAPDLPMLGTYLTNPTPGCVRLDAADAASVAALTAEITPRAYVICAAVTSAETCETRPELSYRTNVRVPAVLAEVCADRGIPLVYLSTDYVFDGTAGPYGEDADTAPVNAYGRDKAQGEKLVLAGGDHAAVLRTSVVYGGARPGAVDQIRHVLGLGQRIALSAEHQNTPTDAADLAWLVRRVLASGAGGVYHAAGPETMTRFDLGTAVARACGLPVDLVEPLTADAAAAAGKAPRPRQCGLRIDRAVADFGYDPVGLREGLSRCYPDG
ncbi:MAG TPA: sugar nucleotide-binding protein [Actinocatenispora sp.]